MKSWVILTQRHEQIAILTLPSHDSLKHKWVHRTILETSISYSFDHWVFFLFSIKYHFRPYIDSYYFISCG